ncbi:hypothetical protein [uncultured Prevotella sp.]|uniref:hypothetical protein n=1 Tax=uncultured Prevotella sp. TaxID=159272 RepID=UPI00261D8CBB|nr:hypothetical protein [uncultured Prevotella sp.]
MIKTNILKCHFASRLIMACLMAVGSFACALADNKVTIESFNIKPGEEKTVAVCLDNSDRITALQMDIALPDGIVYVANSLTRDEVRLDRDYHSLFMSTLSDGNLRLLIVPSDTVSIFGDSGAVAYFKVKAENSFVKAGKIDFTNILGSSHEKGEDGYTKSFPMADFSADVAPYVGKLYTAADTLAIKTDGTSKKVSLVLDNFINVRGMQALITLPQGLSFEVKDNGKPKFEYGSRLPQNATISSNMTSDGKLKIAVAGMTTENFAGTTGEVLAFYVKADETLALKSELVINDVIVSNENGNAFGLYDEVKLSVTNSYLAHYTPAKALVDSLRNLYNEAVDSIAANAANVKDNEDILAAEAAIVAKIDSLQKVVDDSYANETLAEGLADVQAGADDIATSIKALVENALAAQAGKEAVNEEAYKRLTAQITSLQTELDAAKETINTECKDVASQFTEVINSIQTRITEISDSVKTAYEAVELTSESTIDSLSVKASIAQLLVDAKAAQAVVTANEAAYNRLTAEIASLQLELDAAKETINTECKDVASQFTEVIDSIQSRITEISDSIKTAYEAGELTAESTIDSQSVKDSIEKLLSEAKAAQTVVDANEAAYARLTEELEALQAELDSAEETVNTECKDVADQFVDDIKAIQDEIDEISEKVESDYEAVKLTEESTIDSQTVKDAIANLLADAEKAQKDYEEATGIYGITIDDIQNGDVEIYDITGKKLNSLVRGKLNIVKYSNGKIYKIQVK